jgi:hypothetical protein
MLNGVLPPSPCKEKSESLLAPPHVAPSDFKYGRDTANFTEQLGSFLRRFVMGVA